MAKRATTPAPEVRPHRQEPPSWWLYAGIVIATLVAYMPAWHGGMLWDDNMHITKSSLRSIDGLWRIWFDVGATQQYYPVLHSTFWMLHRVFGDQTLGYHLVNIVLHAGSSCLFVILLRQLRVPGAALAGVIFALHPVHVESVAWITELKNTLSGVFYLVAAIIYLRFDTDRRRGQYGLALGFFVLAILTKTVTATLPAALLVVIWWQRGAIRWREDVLPLLPFFTLGIAAGLGTVWVERELIGASGPAFDFSPVERVLLAGRAVLFYAATLFWPVNLSFVYPRWNVSDTIWWQYLFPLAVLALLIVCWRWRHRSRAPLAVALLFIGTLFPAMGFFNVYPFIFSFVADHFQYLASLSVIAALAAALTLWSNTWTSSRSTGSSAILLVLGSVLGLLTWRQSHDYVSADALYLSTIERNPNAWMAHLNLGFLRLQRGEIEAAIRDTQTALRLEPNLPQGQNNLGSALRAVGRFEEAERAYRESLRLAPADLDTRYNLALVLIDLNRPAEAVDHIKAYLAKNPDDAAAHGQLGDAKQSLGELVDAIIAYRESLRLNPNDSRVHTNLGSALGRQGRLQEAIAEFTEALRLDPSNERAQRNLELARSRLAGGG
jgi:tetratricopeptide (TPR) repeat protein